MAPKRIALPPIGTVLFEVGVKEDMPSSKIIISWVYCGVFEYNTQRMHLLVEFSKWFNLRNLGIQISAEHGLKIPSDEQLMEGRLTWKQLRTWIAR